MPKLTVEGFGELEVPQGKRLVLALEDEAKVDQLHACGGNARCTTCRVEFVAEEPSAAGAGEGKKASAAGREFDAVDSFLTNMVIAAVVGGLAVLILGLLMPRTYCPAYRYQLPKITIRYRRSGGGWICPKCGCGIDRSGRLV